MIERPRDDDAFDDVDWLDALLASGVDDDDPPAALAGLASVLLAARAPATAAELEGEAQVSAMFR